jgi:hypothetical protein
MNDIISNPSLWILCITFISLSIKIVYIFRYHRYPRSITISSCPSCACVVDFPQIKDKGKEKEKEKEKVDKNIGHQNAV